MIIRHPQTHGTENQSLGSSRSSVASAAFIVKPQSGVTAKLNIGLQSLVKKVGTGDDNHLFGRTLKECSKAFSD